MQPVKYAYILILFMFCALHAEAQTKILVFSKTNGYRHASIEAGQQMFKKLKETNEWQIQFSEDSVLINDQSLAEIDVLVFLNTGGNILGLDQKNALQKYIKNGGGFVAIHGAAATEKQWQWYIDIVGGTLKNHPKPQTATINIVNKEFKAMAHFGATWLHFDEWYNFKAPLNSNCIILATLDQSSYEGSTMGESHPITWYQYFEGAKVFTTALGHTKESYANPDFMKMIEGAVTWAKKE